MARPTIRSNGHGNDCGQFDNSNPSGNVPVPAIPAIGYLVRTVRDLAPDCPGVDYVAASCCGAAPRTVGYDKGKRTKPPKPPKPPNGRTSEELRQELQQSVEDYLEWCAEEGTKPEKTWQGKLTIRVDEDLRHRLAAVAAASGESINAWITRLLDRETRRMLEEQEVAG